MVETSNVMKYKAYIFNMRISSCLQQPAPSTICQYQELPQKYLMMSLVIVPVAMVSNETSHNRNVAFINNKPIFFAQEINPVFDTFHFWSNGCVRQF